MSWNHAASRMCWTASNCARCCRTIPASAARAILIAAQANMVDAQALLGQILLDGTGIEQDAALALVWFQIAARNGHAMATNMAGRCHEHGWGCEPDAAKAAEYYRLAAEADLDWGFYNYGNLLATGRGVNKDQARALACYRKAAQMGHAKSMNLLGRYLEEGLCCECGTWPPPMTGIVARRKAATSVGSSATPPCWQISSASMKPSCGSRRRCKMATSISCASVAKHCSLLSTRIFVRWHWITISVPPSWVIDQIKRSCRRWDRPGTKVGLGQ
jgi:TPR repeat protein